MRSLIVAFPLVFCLNVLPAQNLQAIEKELVKQFRSIEYWSTFRDTTEVLYIYDSLEAANKRFLTALLAYTSSIPATLNYDFKDLETLGVTITTSEDRLFRIYSWNTWTGGTGHIYAAVFQHKNNNRVFSKSIRGENGDMGMWYSRIYSLTTEDKTYYLVIGHGKHSSNDLHQSIRLFCIEGDVLNGAVKLFKTRTGIRNELSFGFNLFSLTNRTERPYKLIYYEEDEKKLILPVVLEDGKVTKGTIIYQFNGEYFVQIQ